MVNNLIWALPLASPLVGAVPFNANSAHPTWGNGTNNSSFPIWQNGTTLNSSATHVTSGAMQSQPALSAAIHWDQQIHNYDNIKPKTEQSFYYTKDGIASKRSPHVMEHES